MAKSSYSASKHSAGLPLRHRSGRELLNNVFAGISLIALLLVSLQAFDLAPSAAIADSSTESAAISDSESHSAAGTASVTARLDGELRPTTTLVRVQNARAPSEGRQKSESREGQSHQIKVVSVVDANRNK